MMNAKERVRTALAFEEPDRPPVYAAFVPEIGRKLRLETGAKERDLGAAMGNDMVLLPQGFANGYYLKDQDEYTCDWGCKWRRVKNATGEYTEVFERPLEKDPALLDSYKIPDAEDDARYAQDLETMRQYGQTHWIVGSTPCSIFEASWGIRGLENLLMDMVAEHDFAHALFDKVMQFPLIAGKKHIAMGANMLWLGDDVATQQNLMMSLSTWREYFRPRYAQLFAEYKKMNPEIKLAYHSCGNCEAILDDMAEIGLDVINPIQPAAMDPVQIKKRYGKRLALFGGLCVQYILPGDTSEEVTKEVRRLKSEVGRGGGYILAPAHNIQSDTPLGNILAFYEEALKSGDD
jgi:uroporphyrinogen decarboxylase